MATTAILNGESVQVAIINNINTQTIGSNNRNPLETIVQSDLNPGTGPLYYSDYGI